MGGGLWQGFFLQTGAKSKVNEASQKRSLEFGPTYAGYPDEYPSEQDGSKIRKSGSKFQTCDYI